MASQPRWRRAFDRVERAVGEPLEELTDTEGFAAALARVAEARRRVRRGVRGVSARLLHLVNLPAQSDVTRLSRQLASLEQQVRLLATRQAPSDGPATAGRANPDREDADAERAESD